MLPSLMCMWIGTAKSEAPPLLACPFVKRLRGKLDYTRVGYAFLPDRFTLRDVQEVHEAILGRTLTKPPFRRKLLDRGMIEPTGEFEKGGAYRPAELYQLKR